MLYVKNALYLDAQTLELFSGTLAVEPGPEGRVRVLAADAALPEDSAKPASSAPPAKSGDTVQILDCAGALVTQSWGCGHQHCYSALSRGMPPVTPGPTSFLEVLQKVWWRLDKCLDKEMIEASALAAALDMLEQGVSLCIDHHASPYALRGSLALVARAFARVGIRPLLCYEVSCRDGEALALAGLEEQEDYLSQGGQGHVGLHASFTVSDEVLRRAVALAQRQHTGLHIHVAEAPLDQEHCQATYGCSVGQRLADAGVLDLPQTILAHCVHLSPAEISLVAQAPCWVAQSVESNLNNAVGLASYAPFTRVMLGTDGMHGDMLRSAQAAFLVGRSQENVDCATVYRRLRAVHAHAALHCPRGDGLVPGSNSLTVYAYDSPTPLTRDNVLGHLFFGLRSAQVRSVISEGRLALHEGRCLLCDSTEIRAFAREQARRLWKKMQP